MRCHVGVLVVAWSVASIGCGKVIGRAVDATQDRPLEQPSSDGSSRADGSVSLPDAELPEDAAQDARRDAPVDAAPRPSGIVFETNFAQDGDYQRSGGGLWNFDDVPTGWDGVRTNQGTIRGVEGAGVGGSVAMKFEWPAGGTAAATSLGKHLTGDRSTGYADLYIRYNMRLPDGFRAGRDGVALPFWKWGRLWQNTGLAGSGWTERRPDSYYIVWNWGSGLPRWGIRNGLTFGENLNTDDRGCAGGPRTSTNWYVSGSDRRGHHVVFDGHWDSVGGGAWEFDHASRDLLTRPGQGWHTFEWHFRLSSTDTANDGEFQVWFDGVEQFCPNPIEDIDQRVDRPSTTSSLVTAAKPGMNFFTLMDNLAEWSSRWDASGVEGGIYINDVVISTERIGHDYMATGDGS
ncbi:MAG: hypothetical protein AAGF12_12670 [Myxococcota bacterium]